MKTIKLNKKDLLSPWITKGIKKSSRTKQRLYEKYLRSKKSTDFEMYKNFKKLFESIRKKSKLGYYNKQIQKNIHDSRKTWQTIKEIIGKTRIQKNTFPTEITLNNETFNSKDDIANLFNSFFVNVGPKLSEKIRDSNQNFETYLTKAKTSFGQFQNLIHSEKEKAFNNLKLNKSPGYDDISSDIVKKSFNELFLPLHHVFTLSLNQGVFPEKLKMAKVTPIYKAGNQSLLTNYRPISVLPTFSKILERIMYNRFYDFLTKENLLYNKQFGFRKKTSTEHAILELVNNISNAFNDKNYALGVFVDLSKAFDTVNHKILLKKLEYYGLNNENLNWFESYLSARSQFIEHDNIKTNPKTV